MLKSKTTRILFLVLVLLVIVLAALEAKSILDAGANKVANVSKTKKIGPYSVNVEQTAFQKEVEPELEKALTTKNGRIIVEQMSKYFISELFTLRDKKNSNDVGGLGFVLPKVEARFKTNAIDAYYADIADYIKDYKIENLPLVTSVNVEKPVKVNKATANLHEDVKSKIKLVFDVKVNWTYEENSVLDTTKINLVNSATIRVVQDQNLTWWVYELVKN